MIIPLPVSGGGDDNPISAIIEGASDVDDSMPENTVFGANGEVITLNEDEENISHQ